MNLSNKGSVSVEIAAMIPVIALFLLIAFQFASLFSKEVLNVAEANAKADAAIREWEEDNSESGFTRPCLELMGETSFRSEMTHFRIGSGAGVEEIATTQEVRIVSEPICLP